MSLTFNTKNFLYFSGLVGGLASEKIRWSDSVMRFREQVHKTLLFKFFKSEVV